MERIKVEKNTDYTVISNIFLKDGNLGLKSKGFLAVVMSLPDSWDFSISGMAAICKEGKSAIYSSIKELMQFGYCKRTYIYDNVRKNGKLMKLRVGVLYAIAEKPTYLDLDKLNKDNLNQANLNLDKLNDNNKVNTKSSTKSNQVKSKSSKDSVVTDTPPLESETNLSEIPTGSENDFYENLTAELKNEAANLKKEVETLKEKTLQKKVNSGGGGEKNVDNSNKPKKQPVQRLNLSSLTDTQKIEINAVLRRYDDENAAKLAWLEWLEHKSTAGGKIKQYKDHATALKALELASKQAQFQSEALTDAVNNSIANEYQGIFPENFVKKQKQNGNFNSKIDRATANNDYLEGLRNGIGFPDWGSQSQV